MFRDYHAVSIRHSTRCCGAVKALDGKRYLSTEAPSLPLSECASPAQCHCKYRHHNDRRNDYRRDTDFGLPDRSFFGSNRRALRGRRSTDVA